jgi:DNA recombination protein RmuC
VTEILLMAVVVALAVIAVLLGLRRLPDPVAAVEDLFAASEASRQEAVARMERGLAEQMALRSREQREELAGSVARLSQTLMQQMTSIASVQNHRVDGFATQLARLTEANEARLAEIRQTLESRLAALQQDNGVRLDEMRRTVDEKLHATLEQRLGESFRLVSDRLDQVHRGLGEMQALAADVGDLKRVLTNVKTRGVWGEVQLAALLEQMLVPEQYAVNIATVPGSSERVEFALRLPGQAADSPVWLPIDAKFPREDYERLQAAHEAADARAAERAARQLAARVRDEARAIRAKYVSPPATTDFAILFLPTEGLYAEIVRRPGLLDVLQREHRVVVAGPTTLAAILSSLQMGFRTLAVEKRSSEVWQLLGAVKTEFGKFGDLLARTRQQLDRAVNTLGSAQTRTRQIERRLRDVALLPEGSARDLLAVDAAPGEGVPVDGASADPLSVDDGYERSGDGLADETVDGTAHRIRAPGAGFPHGGSSAA